MVIRPMLMIQCLGISAAVVTSTATHLSFRGIAPDSRLFVVDTAWTLFIVGWVSTVLWIRLTNRLAEDTPDSWYFHSMGIYSFGNIAALVSFIFLAPYCSLDGLLLACAFCIAPAILQSIGTVRAPQLGPRSLPELLVPVVMPLGIGLCLLAHNDLRAQLMGGFQLFMVVGLLLLREVLQGLVNRLHAAHTNAEHERDARNQFLVAVSHDLVQPLQSAHMQFEQTLREPAGSERMAAQQHAHLAIDSAERLLSQFVDRMRPDGGAEQTSMQVMHVGLAIQRAVGGARLLADLKDVELRCVNSELRAWADPGTVERILGNLIGIALRHANTRRVLVGARRCKKQIHVWVIDDGMSFGGMDRRNLVPEHLHASATVRIAPDGFEFGLFPSTKLTRLVGGKISMVKTSRRGAAFRLDLLRA